MLKKAGITLAFMAALFCTVAEAEENLAKHWVIERSELMLATDGIKTIEIKNAYGTIRTRGSDSDELEVFAVIQHHQKDMQRPVIHNYRDQDRLILEVIYPQRQKDSGSVSIPGFEKRRIDVSAFVPRSLGLKIETTDDLAESKGQKGLLDIKTDSGKINIKTEGWVNAVSERGAITAIHQNDHWEQSSTYQTKTGNIGVMLTSSANILVQVDTSGKITTDYSIEIESHPGSTRKMAKAVVGKRNQTLNISSTLGDVELTRKINMLRSK